MIHHFLLLLSPTHRYFCKGYTFLFIIGHKPWLMHFLNWLLSKCCVSYYDQFPVSTTKNSVWPQCRIRASLDSDWVNLPLVQMVQTPVGVAPTEESRLCLLFLQGSHILYFIRYIVICSAQHLSGLCEYSTMSSFQVSTDKASTNAFPLSSKFNQIAVFS